MSVFTFEFSFRGFFKCFCRFLCFPKKKIQHRNPPYIVMTCKDVDFPSIKWFWVDLFTVVKQSIIFSLASLPFNFFLLLRACGFTFHSIEFDRHFRLCTILKSKKRQSFRRSAKCFCCSHKRCKNKPNFENIYFNLLHSYFPMFIAKLWIFFTLTLRFLCVLLPSKLGSFWFTKHFFSLPIFMISPLPLLLPYEIYYSWIWEKNESFCW